MAAAEDAGRAGDSVANATHDLYRQYGKQIYAYCLHQLRSREEAEDAVQTTFLNAFRGLQRGTTTRFEQAWLYKIAQNVCIARRSSSGRRLRLEAPDDFEVIEEVVPSAGGSAADTLELMGLDEALERMPESQRRAILLREWQGLSYREIASELDLSQGAVEMLIFRARKTLATALEEPDAAKRRGGKARTGFSFGSLIAALKGLFATGAAMKMAAVAVSAVVVGTNAAVHAAAHRAVAKTKARAADTQIIRARPPHAAVVARSVALVAWHAPHADATGGSARARSVWTAGSAASTPKPVVVDDVPSDSMPVRSEPANQPAASTGSTMVTTVSLVAARAPAATPSSPPTQPASSAPSPPSTTPTTTTTFGSSDTTTTAAPTTDPDTTTTTTTTTSNSTTTPTATTANTVTPGDSGRAQNGHGNGNGNDGPHGHTH